MIATILVIFIGILKIINSDLMKPTFNDLLGAGDENPMTTTHMNYMMNPIIMVFDKIFDKLFPWLDKYDFDAAKLNAKIGFWGSKICNWYLFRNLCWPISRSNTNRNCFFSFYSSCLLGIVLIDWIMVYRFC
mgnify:CR=1 FL=1